jgi:glycine/D-amino acid oxidase-like deaminating enzyme
LKAVARKIGFKNIQDKESIYYAASAKDIPPLRKEFEARKNMGFDVAWLRGSDLEKETGIHGKAAIISTLAAQTNAYQFTHALHAASTKQGLKIYDRTKAIAVDHRKNGELVHLENGHTIQAKKIIYATGYETINYVHKPLVKIRSTYVTISESYPSTETFWNKQRLIWNTADPYLYIRTTPDQRIMVGGRDENFYSPVKRNKLIKTKSKQLAADFNKLVPGCEFIPEFNWAGSFGFTRDGLPYIGTLSKWPNSYFALGFGGNGITFSMIASEIIIGLLVGKKIRGSEVFSFDR